MGFTAIFPGFLPLSPFSIKKQTIDMKLLDSLEKPEHNARRQCDEMRRAMHGRQRIAQLCACFATRFSEFSSGLCGAGRRVTEYGIRSPAIAFLRVS
jgi:hypothetical protein